MAGERAFDLVLFDLGGTLIYFDAAWPEVVATQHRTLAQDLVDKGYALDVERFALDFGARLTAYYQERETEFLEQTIEYILRSMLAERGFADAPKTHLRPALDRMYAVSQAHWQLEADATATLQTLLDQGYRLGLISNANDAEDVHVLIDNHDLRHFFEHIYISAALVFRKPHPRIFQIALSQYAVSPERAVMVGDTLGADVLGARNSGLASVWITRRANAPGNRDHLDTIQPDASIDTLSELPGLLANWDKRPR